MTMLEITRVRITWLAIALAVASYLTVRAEEPRDAAQSGRRLEGQSNFRDLGGYRTSDGRAVKFGEVFRSGELPHLTGNDLRTLKKLEIRTVVNFLTEEEIKASGKDCLPDGVIVKSLPIAGGDAEDAGLAGTILQARKEADFSDVPVELNPEIHRILIREGREQYASLLRDLADPKNRPLVFHCSHGVHRTGTAAAIVLSALGVPWETVRKDYLLSNEYRREEIDRRLEELRRCAAKNRGIEPHEVDMTNFEAFYRLEPEYIDASLDEAVRQYGSMDAYIRRGLDIKDDLLERLRGELLE